MPVVERHPAASVARYWTFAVGATLFLCVLCAAFQTGFLSFASSRASSAHASLGTQGVVAWVLVQKGGAVTHIARQSNRTDDGRSVVLSSGVAFEAVTGAIRAAPPSLSLDPSLRVDASTLAAATR